MKSPKRYYTCIRIFDATPIPQIYYASEGEIFSIIKSFDFIIPLDRKPRNSTNIITLS